MDVIDTHQHFWHYDPRHLPWINDTMASLKGDHLPEKVWPEM
jgi:L-fuconolactonase